MDKKSIIAEIKRTAAENSGRPLGVDLFCEATGIRKEDWYGIYWAKWSEAQVEAGFEPNQFGETPLDIEQMTEKIALLARDLGKFPTKPQCKLRKRSDPSFPSNDTIRRRLGSKSELISRVSAFCAEHEGWDDVLAICESTPRPAPRRDSENQAEGVGLKAGHVYLLKHNSEYKIGHSTDASRRYKEIRVQMPFETEEVHVIETDDAVGIEAYWHNRFKDKRLRGEWFRLTSADVRAFAKRKFM